MTDEATIPVERLPEEWAAALDQMGERSYRTAQVLGWIFQQGVTDPAAMTNLPVTLRDRLRQAGLREPGHVAAVHRSVDGTRKLVIDLCDGARVECVLIPMSGDADAAPDDDPETPSGPRPRATICISTQYGCKRRCGFCASGQAGLGRQLGAGEILAQLLLARRHLDPGEGLGNVVFMGMGEPLDNLPAVVRAVRLMVHPQGVGLGLRRITVSTVGVIPGIAEIGREFGGKLGLAISLHAPDDATRDRLVPINRQYPIAELIAALRRYPLPQRRRFTIEYTLIQGVNDSVGQARALVGVLRALPVKVNLIPMNPIPGSRYRGADPDRVEAFQRVIADAKISCFVRTRRGDDVVAACGQLAMGLRNPVAPSSVDPGTA
jgi:23S rRNA (adenine2503-C2)-methyltransferase